MPKNREESIIDADHARIEAMFAALDRGDPRARPSRYWENLNRLNLAQLAQHGYPNFKRTIARNYFTWTKLLPWDSQILFLCRRLPPTVIVKCMIATFREQHEYFSGIDRILSLAYNFLTLLLWEYVLRLPLRPELIALREPEEGNPPLVSVRPGMAVSQDLANSILEYDTVTSVVPGPGPGTILELGAGYGRTAFVFLKMRPGLKYILADIPPALWVAERYLSTVFPERRIFPFRDFQNFADVADEFHQADIAFLVSTQLDRLPPESIDMVINISSLHEMWTDQIHYYFEQFDRVLKPGGHMYTKQWRKTQVGDGGPLLLEDSYPIPQRWRRIFRRVARVQTRFFEAIYLKSAPDETA